MRNWIATTMVLGMGLVAQLSGAWASTRYVTQAAAGELRILLATRPIAEAATDFSVDPGTRRLLGMVPAIKAWGQAQGLRPTESYGRFADLHRPAAAWVVQATPPLSFELRRWSFPVVGSVPYLGFFDEPAARREAARLARDEGLDVDVRTARAFSTLGWLRDPVLSTMLGDGASAPGELANVVLHESVHATLYVKDQSPFNESIASFVADRLTATWLAAALGADAPETRAWLALHAAEHARVARLHAAYEELDALYRSGASDEAKRAGKAQVLARAAADVALGRPLGNAVLSGFRTYDVGVTALERLLARCEGSWPRFFTALRTLTPVDFGRPQRDDLDAVLARLVTVPVAATSSR